jgi:DNA-directed RNA polymerase sigma subunit (sigma70/sigma32)
MGVTKERIRQIEARALSKLRLAAQEEKISLDL